MNMHIVYFPLAVMLPIFALNAAPTVKFDSKTVDCGTFVEGKTEKLDAVFTLKNTGDKPLKIKSVRPGCGCTVVDYDTVVAPEKTAKIRAGVNIKGYHSGKISKGIRVSSNAANEPEARLTIKAVIQAIIDVSESYISIPESELDKTHTVSLASRKDDLKVSGITFKPFGKPENVPLWQKEMAPSVKFEFTRTDSVRADGFRVYELKLYPASLGRPCRGKFRIKTNHPDKQDFTIRGRIGG